MVDYLVRAMGLFDLIDINGGRLLQRRRADPRHHRRHRAAGRTLLGRADAYLERGHELLPARLYSDGADHLGDRLWRGLHDRADGDGMERETASGRS